MPNSICSVLTRDSDASLSQCPNRAQTVTHSRVLERHTGTTEKPGIASMQDGFWENRMKVTFVSWKRLHRAALPRRTSRTSC